MTTLALGALIVITLAALAGVNIINQRQQQLKQLARRREQLSLGLENLEEGLEACLQTVENTATCCELAREKCALLKALLDTEHPPSNKLVQARLDKAETELQQLSSGLIERRLDRLCHSDTEIKVQQAKLANALRFIHKRQTREQLTIDQALEHSNQIEWARLMISVLSMVGAGYLARENDQQISAFNYFRKAQELLQASQHPDPRRLALIRELSELMQQPGMHLSEEYFPEYTPEENAQNIEQIL
ncbi:hypothetical protein [Gilvimarinus chinensis]|uniref:hypothetical protein n=1 Tax=Gilvimarinus chinensis TaxID=396005 RepID=UPI00036653AF|nr:hypothetical protein [Gilvimarinus chinensis]